MTTAQTPITRTPETASFFRNGFYGPISLLSAAQCDLARRHLTLGSLPDPLGWEKGRAATDRLLYDLATRPKLLSLLRALLGENIILWGAGILTREPGQMHPWHSDIESSAPDQHFVSVWIGIENTDRDSALQLISRSHLFGKTIQEVAHEKGVRRGETSRERVIEWAGEYDPDAKFVQPAMQDGEALIFDGRLWHSSNNTRRQGPRSALLFQYAAAESPVLMPDFTQLEWPFRHKESRVPVIAVSGNDGAGVNYLVAPPVDAVEQLTTEVKPIGLPLPEDPVARWQPHHLFAGSTPNLQRMSSHCSVLSSGHCPHPPHAHREEELLIVLGGEAELVISDAPPSDNTLIKRLRQGSFVYYPAYQYHTIRNATAAPISYLMFKWTGAPIEIERPLEMKIVDLDGGTPESQTAFSAQVLLEGATAYLNKLHAHLSVLQAGAGYEPHIDEHDVAIVVLAGKLETLGQTVESCGVIYYAAGELHGMKNIGHERARYLALEFRAPKSVQNRLL
jgi:quercetin dioxygenase-like cupin family protein